MNGNEQDSVRCRYCGKQIAVPGYHADPIEPSPEELMNQGCVPVPDFGWFCTQICGNKYGKKHKVPFRRNKDNQIQYYGEEAENGNNNP